MIQMAQQLNLTKCALRVHVIVEGVCYLLDRNHLVRLRVQHGAANITEVENQSTICGNMVQIKDEKGSTKAMSSPDESISAAADRHDWRAVL